MYERHGHAGETKSPTYQSWQGMHSRCKYPTHKDYSNYGARGIKVCNRWFNFVNFLEDMGERPKGLTLDRKDCTKDYCKENCKWSTAEDQCLNQQTRKDNKSGRKGVSKHSEKFWIARATLKGNTEVLYFGPSFEEACKAREAWELANGVPYYGS
jgi:hypothetical protein